METKKMMMTMYRGVRLGGRYQDVDDLKHVGMRYYWNSSDDAIADIFRMLSHFNKISKLGRVPILRDYILEAARPRRMQMFATIDKDNATSYATNTPELISSVAGAAGITLKQKQSYFKSFYGKPYVVTFDVELEIGAGINTPIGNFIPKEQILKIEPVDISQPDPWLRRLSTTHNRSLVLT